MDREGNRRRKRAYFSRQLDRIRTETFGSTAAIFFNPRPPFAQANLLAFNAVSWLIALLDSWCSGHPPPAPSLDVYCAISFHTPMQKDNARRATAAEAAFFARVPRDHCDDRCVVSKGSLFTALYPVNNNRPCPLVTLAGAKCIYNAVGRVAGAREFSHRHRFYSLFCRCAEPDASKEKSAGVGGNAELRGITRNVGKNLT